MLNPAATQRPSPTPVECRTHMLTPQNHPSKWLWEFPAATFWGALLYNNHLHTRAADDSVLKRILTM